MGRPSPLGNPYSHVPSGYADIRVKTRDEAVDKYRLWIEKQLQSDNEASRAFWELVGVYRDFGGLTLSCWCAPKRCHAEVLAEMIKEAVSESREAPYESEKQGEAVEA